MGFYIAFIIIYFLFNEITYMVAVDQSIGINRHASSGWLSWLNRLIMFFTIMWYMGLIAGIIIFFLTLFTFNHLTLGWIFNIPQLLVKSDTDVIMLMNLKAGLLVIISPILLVFTIASVTYVEYSSLLYLLTSSTSTLLTTIGILVIGFLVREFISIRYFSK